MGHFPRRHKYVFYCRWHNFCNIQGFYIADSSTIHPKRIVSFYCNICKTEATKCYIKRALPISFWSTHGTPYLNTYNYTPIKIPGCEAWHILIPWPASQHTYYSSLVDYRAFFEKLLVTQIAKKFPASLNDEGFFCHIRKSQHTYLRRIFNIILPSRNRLPSDLL